MSPSHKTKQFSKKELLLENLKFIVDNKTFMKCSNCSFTIEKSKGTKELDMTPNKIWQTGKLNSSISGINFSKSPNVFMKLSSVRPS